MSMGILQARILEWVAISFSGGGNLSNPGIGPRSPALQVDALPSELLGKPNSKGGEGVTGIVITARSKVKEHGVYSMNGEWINSAARGLWVNILKFRLKRRVQA